MFSPGADEVDRGAGVREERARRSRRAERRDREDVRQRGRELERVALGELVAGRGDGDDPARDGGLDRDVLREAEARRAVAHVDDRGAGARSPRRSGRPTSRQVMLAAGSGTFSARAPGHTPTMPTPLTGAAATEAVAVPWELVTGNCSIVVGVAALPLGMRAVELGVDERDQRAVGVDRRRAPAPGRRSSRASRSAAPTADPGRPPAGSGSAQRVGLGVDEQAAAPSARANARALRARDHVAAGAGGADVAGAEPARHGARPRLRAGRRRSTSPRAAGAEAATASPGSAIGARARRPPPGARPERGDAGAARERPPEGSLHPTQASGSPVRAA